MVVNGTDDAVVAQASSTSSASVHEAAGKVGALPSSLKPLAPGMRVIGRAFPVLSPGGDNLWLHRAIYAAEAGDILVVATGGSTEFGYWGEVMTRAAMCRGLGGLVIEGGVRDSTILRNTDFPIFCYPTCIKGTVKDPAGNGALGTTVKLGDVTVGRGDLVLGDDDGIVVIPANDAAKAVALACQRDVDEIEIFDRLARGATTIEIYSLPVQSGVQP